MGSAKGGGKLPTKPGSKKTVKPKRNAPKRPQTPAPAVPRSTKLNRNDKSNGQEVVVDRGLLPANHDPLRELSEKHLYFCKRYVLNGGNGCKAARESGFNQWYGTNVLIKDPLVMARVESLRAERRKKFDVNADRIIFELCKVAFGSLGDFLTIANDGTPIIDCTNIGPEEMAALAEITQDTYTERQPSDDGDWDSVPVKKTKIKLHSKVQALEQLARIFKLFQEGDGKDDGPEEKAAKIRAALRKMIETDGV